MGIKETPTNFRVYYKTMRTSIRPKYEKAVDDYEKLFVEEKALHSEIMQKVQTYKDVYKIDISTYEEFINNEYKDGVFYEEAKSLFVNKKNKYSAVTVLYKLYKLARQQKELSELKHQINLYEKMLDLNLNQYREILESFYNEVHKKLIIDGCGYVLENPIGWICINRCKVIQGKSRCLDFQATKRNKAKLLAEGKRLYNQDEAKYAKMIGADYDGVDYRVYRTDEYVYEIPLINCRVTKGEKLRLEPTARRAYTVGKTDEQMIEECNRDLNKICELPIDLKRKLSLCLKTDDILYLNYIRNEAQQSIRTPKANRKSR